MELANAYLVRYERPFQAYTALQSALIRQYIAQGGSPELWCEQMAPCFRRKYGWMLEACPPPTPHSARHDA